MGREPKRKRLIVPKRGLILPTARRPLPRPAPWIWIPKRFAPRGSVAFVSSGSADNGLTSNLAFSTTFNIGTVTSNGALVIFLVLGGNATATSLAVTWNGVSMFTVASTTVSNAGQGFICTLFGLINPASGSHSAAATWATTSSTSMMGFWSFTGADQSANSTTFINGVTNVTGNNTSKSQAVTTANGDATVFGWGCGQDPTGVSGNAPTPDWIDTTYGNDNGTYPQGQHILSTTASDSYTVAIGTSDFLMGAGCHIKASSVADTLAAMPQLRFM